MPNFNSKVANATKWSAVTEIVAKLIGPISSMVLARLLTPEAFGVVTTLAMIISFAELFTDAGFQKYLIQHEFLDDKDEEESTNVAFWSNFIMSLAIWGIISVFADPIASLVGNPGLGYVLIIACVSIPLAAFSSIQMALYRRNLDFKTLFKIRIASILIPLIVTIPLAIILRSYWALVLGTIAQNLVNAMLLTYFSKWRPKMFFSFKKLTGMLSFTIWSLFESISIWLTNYVDVFIVGTMLSQHYLGLYKTSSTLVGQIMGLITAATTPVLFSSLSRLQNNEKEFQSLFFQFERLVGLLIIPLGVGIYIFSDFTTSIILGDQWIEASKFVGLWSLTSAFVIVLSHYCSEVYRAKGKPKLSVLSQLLHLAFLFPTVLIAAQYSFETLYTARSLVRFTGIIINLFITGLCIKMSVNKMIVSIIPSCTAAMCMMVVCLFPQANSLWITISYVIIASLVFLFVIMLFPYERRLIMSLPSLIKQNHL